MSLTNPNNLITEERLSEFYQGILPYLGGMPEMVANKFSRCDLYSTSEKMIGQWIDGKPLYQKTISIGNLPDNTIKNVAHNISNLGDVIDIKGFASNAGKTYYAPLPQVQPNIFENQIKIGVTPTDIEISTGSSVFVAYTGYAIIQYTKTTDSPISIGSDTDYSTDEKIVGTWIDGKPIYQKTIVDKTPIVTTDGTSIGKRITISADLDKVITYNIYHEWNNGNNAGLLNDSYTISGGAIRFIRAFIDYAQNEIAIVTDRDAFSNADIYITIQYTKTTD